MGLVDEEDVFVMLVDTVTGAIVVGNSRGIIPCN